MFIIMAANGSEIDFTNWLWSRNFKFSVLGGCYKGQKEITFKVQLENQLDKAILIAQAKRLKQESILIVNKTKASLFYLDGQFTHNVGNWLPVSQTEAFASESYSFDHRENKYYKAG